MTDNSAETARLIERRIADLQAANAVYYEMDRDTSGIRERNDREIEWLKRIVSPDDDSSPDEPVLGEKWQAEAEKQFKPTVSRDREGPSREQIARIIDPDAFDPTKKAFFSMPTYDRALAKADAILSLTPIGSGAIPGGMYGEYTPVTVRSSTAPATTATSLQDKIASTLDKCGYVSDLGPDAFDELVCALTESLSPVLVQLVQTRCVQPEILLHDSSAAKSGWRTDIGNAPTGDRNYFLVRPKGIHPGTGALFHPTIVQRIDGGLYSSENVFDALYFGENEPDDSPMKTTLEWRHLPDDWVNPQHGNAAPASLTEGDVA